MKRKVVKSASVLLIGLILFLVCNASYVLLAFAFRDFSLSLLVMYLFTPPSFYLSWYLIDKGARADFKRRSMAVRKKLDLEEIATVSRELEELSRR